MVKKHEKENTEMLIFQDQVSTTPHKIKVKQSRLEYDTRLTSLMLAQGQAPMILKMTLCMNTPRHLVLEGGLKAEKEQIIQDLEITTLI